MHRAFTEFEATHLTVIVVVPRRKAETTPDDDTDAIDVELDDQVTDLFVVFVGDIVATNVLVCPTDKVKLLLFIRIVRGNTAGALVTVIDDDAA